MSISRKGLLLVAVPLLFQLALLAITAAVDGAGRTRRLLFAAMAVDFAVTVVVALAAMRYFEASIGSRLQIIVDNTERLERGELLAPPQRGNDEIARLDHRIHDMAEALARGRYELEASNAELESFSYSVSHDLRAPLRAVTGYATMLEEDYADAVDAEGKRYLATIRGEAARMGILIDDLLTFSRLGRQQIAAARIDMARVAREAFDAIPSEREKELRIADDLPPADGDPTMLRQVLVNLLDNAVKFSSHNERIVVELDARREARDIVYSVRDHGVGFDPRYGHKLFGVFQRLHSDAEFEGTGVGLAIVQRVIARHGGRVWAESEPGQGARFYFSLPGGAA